jgi:transposase
MGSKRKRLFSREFKVEAVRLATTGSKPVTEVARELDISAALLHTWMREERRKGEEAFPGNGNLSASDEEVRRLRRELARVTEERDILKKATAFFAKESR